VATVEELQRSILPRARTLGPPIDAERAAREIGWVRVLKARVPAFDALDTGDLAIIPGPALELVAPGAAQLEELAAALVRARVPAVILVDGEAGRLSLDTLGRLAADAGLTVLRHERTDPIALERSIIGFLVNRRAELDRRAAEFEGQLARLALLGRGLDALAAAIGSFFGRAVVIEGRRGDRLAVHAPADVPAAASAFARYLANPASVALRVPIPSPDDDASSGGRLALLGESGPAELERVASDRIAAILALELSRDAAVRQAREDVRRGDPLPVDGPPWVVFLARQGTAGGGPDAPAGREQTRADLRAILPPRGATLRGTSESLELRIVAVASPEDPEALGLAARVAAFLRRTVAVSELFDEPAARASAEAAARVTLEAADALAAPPQVARVSRLPAYLLLGNLHNLPDGLRQARDLLAPILVGRPALQQDRMATLEAVLASPSLGDAASRLGVHRNTVAYRVGRIEARSGWNLEDADLRLALQIAIKVVQHAQRGGVDRY
jgi:hypothetical protein